MKLKKLLFAVFATFILLGLFQIPAVESSQTFDVSNSKEINLEIKNDGTYRLKSNFYLKKEEISEIFLMISDENTRIEISSPTKNKIEGEATVEIKFTETGVAVVNKILKDRISGKASDLIPEQYRDLIGLIGIDSETLDNNPILFLYLLEKAKSVTNPTEMVNNRFIKNQENKSLKNLLGAFNLEALLPIQGFESYLPDARIEELELTKYKWEGQPLQPANLTLGFSFTLFENDGVIENYRGNLPMSVNISYLVSKEGEPRIDLIIDSDAELPGYKEEGVWSIQIPSSAKQVLEQTGLLEKGDNTTFSLKVPEGTNLQNLPENYVKTGESTYEWSGEDGNKALKSVVEEGSTSIRMEEKPIHSRPLFWIGVVGAIVVISIVVIIMKKS